MSFEDRIRQSVGRALDDVRARMEQEVRALVQELAASAAEERQLAVAQARDATLLDARRLADQRVADAEARLTATIDRVVADACAREREQATRQARRVADGEAEGRARRLLDAVRALDAATSINEVFDALGAALAREAGRTGVFVVRGRTFQGWALSGFGALDAQPDRLEVPIAQAPLVQRAVQTRHTAVAGDAEGVAAPGGTATLVANVGLAMPLVVGDHVAAVAYADGLTADGREAPLQRGWTSSVELLARHATRCLAAVSAGSSDASEASARRLARLLISEIKAHNEPSVAEGRRAGNLLTRLASQIERARRVYDARVPVSLESRAQLFHQELVATLADGDASRLGASA